MKKSRNLVIAETILMYLAQLLFTIVISLVWFNSELGVDTFLFYCFLGVEALLTIFCVYSIIIAIVNVSKECENPCKTTFICKLILIPWYILNFIYCGLILVGMLNPFLMYGIPLILIIFIGLTYLFMVTTGVHNLSYVLSLIRQKKLQVNLMLIVIFVFHFIFCLDVIGAGLLESYIKKNVLQ